MSDAILAEAPATRTPWDQPRPGTAVSAESVPALPPGMCTPHEDDSQFPWMISHARQNDLSRPSQPSSFAAPNEASHHGEPLPAFDEDRFRDIYRECGLLHLIRSFGSPTPSPQDPMTWKNAFRDWQHSCEDDPLPAFETKLVELGFFTAFAAADFTKRALQSEYPYGVQVYANAAVKMQAEFRKTALAIAKLRRPD